ncbi:MAG: hypothetical protein MUF34_27555 [Polyangiaceae bacterium]|nr:hypothetical protein [Polyangiaceae bacterium]
MPDAPKAPESPPPAPRGPSALVLGGGLAALALAAAAAWALRGQPPSPGGGVPSSSPSAPSPPVASAPRFTSPFAGALRADGSVFVAGRRRGAGGLLVGSYDAEGKARFELERTLDGALGHVDEIDAFASAEGVIASVEGEGGQRRWLRAASSEGLAKAEWEATEASACTTSREVALLTRVEAGFQARIAPIAAGAPVDAGAPLAGTAASLLCAPARAFLLIDREHEHVARSLGAGPLEVSLGDEKERDDAEKSFSVHVAGEELLALRLGSKRGLRFRSWNGAAREASPWVRADLALDEETTFELALVTDDALAVVTTRPIEASRPCPDGEPNDTVAELSIVRRADGVVRRSADRLETWRCGAEPGPFWGGSPRGRFVVAWPRGADSACAKAGVRYGGLVVATAKPEGKSPPRVERLGAPAEAIEDAGCDAERCVAVALGRGEAGACVGVDDERAGTLRVIAYGSKGEGD